jgi:lauroyl/myristoyl acyltransferase
MLAARAANDSRKRPGVNALHPVSETLARTGDGAVFNHAPVGGAGTQDSRFRAMFRYNGVFWRRFAYLGSVYGPDWFTRLAPPVVGAIIYLLVGSNRRGAVCNMERLLRPPRRLHAYLGALEMYADFARCLAETLEYFGPAPKEIRIEQPEVNHLAQALEAGRGAVVVTGHLGNWDVAARALSQSDTRLNLVMAREVNTSAQRFVRDARERAGVKIIYSDESAFSTFAMINALRRNEIVALQIDRVLPGSVARAIPFCGTPAAFPVGPFTLARLARCPLVPVYMPRLGRRHYAIEISGRFEIPRDAGPDALEAVMGEVVDGFEKLLLRYPTQWFQFAPFWREPAGAGGGATEPREQDTLEQAV